MARKSTPAKVPARLSKATSTMVRNTVIPKVAPTRKEVTREQIAKRAYEIYISGRGGSQDENWIRAERELRGG